MTVATPLAGLSAAEKRELLSRMLREQGALPRIAPLSPAQARLWFLDRLVPDDPSYNIPSVLRLPGRLDADALERSLREIARRHETLRTTFRLVDGTPAQVVAPSPSITVPVRDLRDLAPAEREAEAHRLVWDESRRTFDLGTGPLLRALLVRLDDEDHLLVMVVHHIVSDGWSMGVLYDELSTLYTAFAAGRPSPLAELPIQYADFARWQNQWLAGDGLREHLAYWRAQLAGLRPLTGLPTDHPRPAVQSRRGAVHPFTLDAVLVDRLAALGQREGCTLFMTLLAGFQALLHRYTGETDVVVGSPIANRTRPEVEGLIGFFVNTLVLRGDLEGDPTFRALLGRVREVTLGAYAHQDMPFEKLVEELQPERDLGRNPFFQVMFSLANAAGGTGAPAADGAAEPPAASQQGPAGNGTAKFDLTLTLVETGAGAQGFLEYNVDLFEQRTAEEMVERFRVLLREAAADPDRPLSRLPLATDEERRAARIPPPRPPVEDTLPARIAEHARRAPDAVAVVSAGGETTYAALQRKSAALAARLRAHGLPRHAPVAVAAEDAAHAVAAALAVLRAGGVFIPLDPADPPARTARVLEDAGASLVLVEAALAERMSIAGATVLVIDDGDAEDGDPAEEAEAEAPAPGDPAVILYLSGAEGGPRGVRLAHRALVRHAIAPGVEIGADDRVARVAGMHGPGALQAVFGALAAGARVVAPAARPPLPPRRLAALLREQRATLLFAPAAQVERLAREFPAALGTVRLVLCAEGPAALRHLRDALDPAVRARVLGAYGAAEAGGFRAVLPLAGAPAPSSGAVTLPPTPGVHLLDASLAPVPPGVVGEICIDDEGVFAGDGDDARAFADAPSGAPGERIFRTGDRARRLADGALEPVGRADGLAQLGEARVEPAEVERALATGPGVADAAVAAREGARGTVLVAFVVPAPGEAPTAATLRPALLEHLPEALVPAEVVCVDALPRTAAGEVDRRALAAAAQAADGQAAPEYVEPRTATETRLARLWSETLGAGRVGVNDSFFRLGGHSLLATQLLARVSDAFGVDVPLQRLFEAPTVAALAQVVEGLGADPAPTRQSVPLVRVPRDRPLPLSFAQQRLWFLDRFEPGSPFYNISSPMRLPGALDERALREALDALVERHESLRTTFAEADGEPVQVVAPPGGHELPVTDLRDLPGEAREAEAWRLAAVEAQTPFDLARGPLFRTRLLRLDDTDHVLLLSIHHIVSDGWSMDVLFRELGALYGAAQSGRPAALPPLPVQYADFARWQREWLSGPVLDEQLRYWKSQLAGAPAVLDLPADRPRPRVQVFRGGMHTFSLPAPLAEALKEMAAAEGATLFMVVLAAFKALLHRYTGETDLVVGSPIANRTRPELEGLIGFFANTLVLRTRVEGALTFRQLLGRVKEVTLGAYAHQDIPFEKLVEELRPERSLAHNPLFQVMLALQNTGRPAAAAGDGGGGAGVGTGVAKFDLTVFLAETTGGIDGGIEYNSDLFDPATVARMARHFERVLAAAADDPDRPIGRHALLSEAELLERAAWAAPDAPYPARPVHRAFEEQARRTPELDAVLFGERRLGYGELDARANFWAHRLRARGVGPDRCVGICMERSVEMVVAVLAVLKAGGAYIPLDPGYPADRLAYMVEAAGAPLLLTQSHLRERLPGASAAVLVMDGDDAEGVRDDAPEVCVEPDHLAYVIYTSGSTGRPKGVAMPHRPLANLLHWQVARSALPRGARTLQFASLSFDVSFQEIFSTLGAGGTLVCLTEEEKRDPGAVWEILRGREVSRLYLPYVALQQLAEHARALPVLPTSLREVITAGEQLQVTPQIARLFARLECPLYNQYGPTETHVVTELALTGPPDAWPARPSIGRPLPNVTVHLLDAYGQPVPAGVPGELFFGGVAPARGYLGRPGLTAERFVPGPEGASTPEGRVYRTGDRGRWLADGTIEFLGRGDGQLKIRGYRVEPEEVEIVLRQHPGVRETVVAARPGGAGEPRLIAWVQPGADAAPAAQELRAHLAARLPEYMLPAAYVMMDALPLTPSGKLDRRALPDADGVGATAAEFLPPRTPVEETLAGIWRQLLRVERVGARDNFFELGGHSLLAARVVSHVRDQLGVELPLRRLFETPTVEGLAVAVVEASIGADDDETARLLAELEDLSDEEAAALLAGAAESDSG